MAFVPLVVGSLNMTVNQGQGVAAVSAPILNAAGTAINLSAWTDLTATAVPASSGPNTADVPFGTVTAASTGIVTVETGASDFADGSPGTARLVISGKPTSGDIVQTLLTGTLTLNPS
jgi:hypothetical protein